MRLSCTRHELHLQSPSIHQLCNSYYLVDCASIRPFPLSKTKIVSPTPTALGDNNGSKKERKAAVEKYMTLLKSGGNDYPMELLKKAGVDLTQPETIQSVVDQLDGLVTKLEQEMAKL